jgi:large subunit ribosomal protein L19e
MKLNTQKRIAGKIFGCSPSRVILDEERLEDIKEAITKVDIRSLIKEGAIKQKPIKGTSKARAKKSKVQKKKGLRKGLGKRKGKPTSRVPKKEKWMSKIRVQRKFLKELREKEIINQKEYSKLRAKSKGGFFRSKRHIKIFLEKLKGKK